VRKFIFNSSLLGAVFGAVSIARATRSGPRDWRLALLWASWGITVALAIGSVLAEANAASAEIEE
jgi:hypothetical protein